MSYENSVQTLAEMIRCNIRLCCFEVYRRERKTGRTGASSLPSLFIRDRLKNSVAKRRGCSCFLVKGVEWLTDV